MLRQDYKIEEDWEGTRYLGITLDWDYTKCKVHLSMPGYVEKAQARAEGKKNRPKGNLNLLFVGVGIGLLLSFLWKYAKQSLI